MPNTTWQIVQKVTARKKMSDEVKEALEKSIAHWEENAAIEDMKDADTESESCALCALFLDLACSGCPVAIRTMKYGCDGSPYEDAEGFEVLGYLDEFRVAARKEVEFLKSLREVGHERMADI